MSCTSTLQRLLLSGAACAAALTLIACASGRKPLEAPPELRPPIREPDAAEPEEEEEQPAPVDSRTVVIEDESPEESARRTLLEAARAERERRQAAPNPTIVITDKNLAEHATGELTIVGSSSEDGEETEAGDRESGAASVSSEPDAESYWRSRVFAARQNWKTTVEEVEHLERRVAELRRSFYEEDDPYYRDTQIKPSWDRSLERLVEAREAAEEFRIEVREILEEGRRAGALPGWLREGIDLEPEVGVEDSEADPAEHESREPSVVEPEEPGGR